MAIAAKGGELKAKEGPRNVEHCIMLPMPCKFTIIIYRQSSRATNQLNWQTMSLRGRFPVVAFCTSSYA